MSPEAIPDVTIEPARPDDHDGWRPLWSGYCTFYEVPDTDEKAATLWSWLMDPAHPVKAFVARRPDGRIVGITHCRPYHRPIAAAVGCFLDDLFVAPEARGSGAAEALVRRVVEEAQANGWSVVRWITAEDNARARALYDRIAVETPWVTYEIRP